MTQPFSGENRFGIESQNGMAIMNRDDLIHRLENLTVPEIEIRSHRRRLKKALLTSRYFERCQKRATIWEMVKLRIKGLISMRQQRIWRVAVAITATALVVGLVIIPSQVEPSPATLVSNIVQKDPAIHQALSGEGEIKVLQVYVSGGTAHVLCGRGVGDLVEADVDLTTKAVTGFQRLQGLFVPELTNPAQTNAINIALGDSQVQELLNRGGQIGRVLPSFSSMSAVTVINDRIVKIQPDSGLAVVEIRAGGKSWLVHINLDEGTVEHIIEPQSHIIPPFDFWNTLRPL